MATPTIQPNIQLRAHQPRRFTSTSGFINHTPRDFDLDVAKSAISARHTKEIMSFTTTLCEPVQDRDARFDYESSIQMTPRSRSWQQPEEKSSRPSTAVATYQRSRLLQPRDEKAARDHIATDLAFFLREHQPPHFDLSELESSAREVSSPKKLKQMLKLGSKRPSRYGSVSGRAASQYTPVNAIQKISKDGTKYLQIVLPETFAEASVASAEQGSPQAWRLVDVEKKSNDIPNHILASDEDPNINYWEESRRYPETSDGDTSHTRDLQEKCRLTPDSGTSSVHHKWAAEGYSSEEERRERYSEDETDNEAGRPQAGLPIVTIPISTLPPVPESRTTSPRNSTAIQLLSHNDHPSSIDSNGSARLISNHEADDTDPVTLPSFPTAPSHNPTREKSVRAIHNKDGAKTSVDCAPSRNSSAEAQRAERTRARKLRDFHSGRQSIDERMEQSSPNILPLLPKTLPQLSNAPTEGHISVSDETIIAGRKSGMGISRIMIVAEQAPVPRDDQRLAELFQTILREHHSPPRPNSIAIRASLPLPALPQQSTSSATTSQERPDAETHPAFRQRTPSPLETPHIRTRQKSTFENRASSRPASCATTPINHSFPSTTTYRGTTHSPSKEFLLKSPGEIRLEHIESRHEARLELLERENRLLDAALRAVLQTAGSLNGCPCRGSTSESEKEGIKRDSRGSDGTVGSDASALDLYMSTRGGFSVPRERR